MREELIYFEGKIMGLLASINREQKQSIFLLQIGTFLEYFDLMLYVHMAVLLNELFFPKTDPHTASLLSAFAFCSAFVFRPIGALIFGWIGDHIGRKSTIVITTSMMAVSCVIMAMLPTYAQIGISAAWILTFCRIMQGMSSMGEIVGAQIYLTETIQRPARYPAVTLTAAFSEIGGMFALGLAFFVTSSGCNWRIAFGIGAGIALLGATARTRLRETPDFLEMKRQLVRKEITKGNLEDDPKGAELNATWKQPIKPQTFIFYFLVSCGWPLCFYLGFIYFNPVLMENYGYSSKDVIMHNFFLSIFSIVFNIFLTFLSFYIHPLKINKVRSALSLIMMLSLPFLITGATSAIHIFLIQVLILLFQIGDLPSTAVFISHFPFYRRFTYVSSIFALARMAVYIITSFGLVYLGNYFGFFGLWFIALPIVILYIAGIHHFIKLEEQKGILIAK